MTIIEEKKTLRKRNLVARAKLPKPVKVKYDAWICEALHNIIELKQYKTIHCYLPMGTEINITPLIQELLIAKKTVVTPKTLPKRKLKNLVLKSLDELEKGVFGTSHPLGDDEYEGSYDLIIIPGLAFDGSNYRLGYGGGYYDNFLVNYPTAKKIGIFYPYQEVTTVPIEAHDIQLDEIIVNRDFTEL